jgi:hypothetical protein
MVLFPKMRSSAKGNKTIRRQKNGIARPEKNRTHHRGLRAQAQKSPIPISRTPIKETDEWDNWDDMTVDEVYYAADRFYYHEVSNMSHWLWRHSDKYIDDDQVRHLHLLHTELKACPNGRKRWPLHDLI